MMKTDGCERILANFGVAYTTVRHQFRPPLVAIIVQRRISEASRGNNFPACVRVFTCISNRDCTLSTGHPFFLQFARSLGLAAECIRRPSREGSKRRVAHCGMDEMGAQAHRQNPVSQRGGRSWRKQIRHTRFGLTSDHSCIRQLAPLLERWILMKTVPVVWWANLTLLT